MNFKAVIFDMDGVLIDSEPFWRKAEIEIFGKCGLNLTDEECKETTGLRIDEVVQFRYQQQPWKDTPVTEVAAQIIDRVIELIESEGQAMAGAYDILEFLEERNIRKALASSSSSRIISTVLDKLQIKDRFELFHSAEDEAQGKPAPDVYLTTAKKMHVEPSTILAIEDSINGMRSAIDAGMTCAVVPEAHTFSNSGFDIAHFKARNLFELTSWISQSLSENGSIIHE